MKDPIVLVNKADPEKEIAYACGKCGTVFVHRDLAQKHCGPWLCKECGKEARKNYTKCDACQQVAQAKKTAERAANALQVSYNGWKGPVFLESVAGSPIGCGEGFFNDVGEAVEYLSDNRDDLSGEEFYMWGAHEIPFSIRAADVIENELDQHHEDAEVSPKAEKELHEFLTKWCAKQDVKSYEIDYKTRIIGVEKVVAEELRG